MALTRITKGVIKPNENYDTHNINSTGIITATKFVGPFDNINVSGAATFTGNVTIGGTLTYEDVTNVDSVGIITAQQGIHVGAGVSAVGVGTFGGLDINGDIDVDGHTNLDNISVAGVTTTTGDVTVGSGGENSALGVRINSAYAQIKLPDGQTGANRKGNLSFGDNDDFRIVHDGHHNYITSGNGNIFISTPSANPVNIYNDRVAVTKDLDVTGDLDVDGHTELDNVNIVGVTTITGSTGNVRLDLHGTASGTGSQIKLHNDHATAYFGLAGDTTGDLLVFDESNTNIKFYTNNNERLRITSGGGLQFRNADVPTNNTEPALILNHAGGWQFYASSDSSTHNNIIFGTNSVSAGERLRIDTTGRVIIANGGSGGTADVNADNFVVKNYESSSACGISILNADNQNSVLYFGNASDSKHAEVVWSDASNLFLIGSSNSGASIKLRSADQSDAVIIDSSQRVGIGTMIPDTLVEIGNAIGTGTANLLKLTSYTNSQSSRPALVFWNNNPNTAQAQISAKGGASYNASKLFFSVANSSRALQDRACIDEYGTFIIGPGEARRNTKGSNQHQALLIEGTGNNSTRMSMIRSSNDDNGPEIQLIKTRGTSIGSVTKPNQNDYIGAITFLAGDDSDLYARGADISVQATGTPANDRVPSDIIFSTTPTSGATSPQEAVRITSEGRMGIDTNSPTAKLNIKDTGNDGAISQLLKLGNDSSGSGTGAGIQLGAGSGNPGNSVLLSGFYDGTGTSFTVETCNTFGGAQSEKFRISNDGRTTIGLTDSTSSSILHLRSNTTAETTLELSTKGNYNGSLPDAKISFTQQNGTELVRIKCDTVTAAPNQASLTFWTNQGGLAERMRIVQNGQILIGDGNTYTPSGMLHIVGDDNSNGPELYLQVPNNNTTDNIGALIFGNTVDKTVCMIRGETHTANNTGDLNFHTSTTGTLASVFRLHSSGDVSIPTVGAKLYTNNSGGNLTVQGGATYPGSAIKFNGGTNGGTGVLHFYAGQTTSLQERMTIAASGRIGMSQSSPDAATLHIGNSYASTSSNVALQVGTISGQNRYLAINHFNNQQNFYQMKMRVNDNSMVPMLDLGNPYGTANHGTAINFHGYQDSKVGAIESENTAANSTSSVDMVLKTGAAPKEVLRLQSNGDARFYNGLYIAKVDNDNSGFSRSGFFLGNPAISEYVYTWSGHSSYTIDLTCASYFSCIWEYFQHQTNGGSRMQQYARGKWSNNHYQHTLNVWEWSGSGGGLTVSFTASDQSGGGSINGLSNMSNNGSTYSGFTNGGGEGSSNTANGRFRISESYNWGSVSSRALIVRVSYGSFNISKT